METLNSNFSQLEPFSRRTVIQDLPSEILEHIFCFLNIKERIRTERVCRRWRDIGTKVLWSYPTKLDFCAVSWLELEDIPITDDVVLAILSRCGKSVRQLNVSLDSWESHLSKKVLNIIGNNCPNLIEFRLTSDYDKCACYLINLAQKCSKLKKVFVVDAPWMNDHLLSTFLKHCHSLEYLDLDGNCQVTGDFIDSLEMDLKGLYFTCSSINVEIVFKKLVKRCPHIAELAVDLPLNCFAPLKMVLHYYSTTLKNLSLETWSFKPSEWYCIPDVIPQLEVLSLLSTTGVDDHLMKILAEKCKKLRSLNLAGTKVTDVGLVALASAPSLTELCVAGTEITSEGIESLATQGRLEKFAFVVSDSDSDSDYEYDSSKLEESCISLAKCCPNLRILILEDKNITDRLVEEINSSLESGFLKGPVCLYVEDTKITRHIKCCPKLRLFFSFKEHDFFSSELNFVTRHPSCPVFPPREVGISSGKLFRLANHPTE